MQSAAGILTASRLGVTLDESSGQPVPSSKNAPLFGGQIDRAVAYDEVKIAQEGRVATGDRAEYIPAREEVHLYGKPAKVTDAERGTLEGVELTYFLANDRIQVQGSPGSPTETRWKVEP
jgi:lipopolysaccharide export system protein LptA